MMQWGIESVAAVASTPAGPAHSPSGVDAFARLLQEGVGTLNARVQTAETALRDLAAGKPVPLHEVMIRLEQARLSVQTFVQVRNKLVESYQDLMRTQL